MPREILVDWTTQSGSDHRSVFWFDLNGTVATQRTALGTFLAAVDGVLDSNVSWLIETSGREVNSASGALSGQWTEPTAKTGTGALSGECVPDAAQVLFRWNTGVIVGSSFLQGRTYIPGLSTTQLLGGNLDPGILSSIEAFGNTLAGTADALGVWHRPIAATGGIWEPTTSCQVWNELAVLRKRR